MTRKIKKIEAIKTLIANDKKMAKSPKWIRYSSNTKKMIAELLVSMSIRDISNELEISRSFVEKIKRSSAKDKLPSTPLQFLELPNSIVKEELPRPTLRLTTPQGISIEIF